jgi:putative RNA 2'-phosphotransferase
MKTDSRSTRISKFLSLVLRHEPARAGLVLDEAGWTTVDSLLRGLAANRLAVTREELERVVATNEKQRFALSEDGQRIRASQGHSIEVRLDYAPQTPPNVLYHGTVECFWESIRRQGLLKGQRHHVHLSADQETALKVGQRRGRPILLRIRAGEMAGAGHVFYRSTNGVWLVEHVPGDFFEVMP